VGTKGLGWGGGGMVPVNPTKLNTVTLCALSNVFLPRSITWSSLETCASLAFWCAARRRATFCSGVSIIPPGVGVGVGVGVAAAAAAPAPAIPGEDGGAFRMGVWSFAAACLELAWGVVAVKRVASDTLRGAPDIGTVCFLESDCFAIFWEGLRNYGNRLVQARGMMVLVGG